MAIWEKQPKRSFLVYCNTKCDHGPCPTGSFKEGLSGRRWLASLLAGHHSKGQHLRLAEGGTCLGLRDLKPFSWKKKSLLLGAPESVGAASQDAAFASGQNLVFKRNQRPTLASVVEVLQLWHSHRGLTSPLLPLQPHILLSGTEETTERLHPQRGFSVHLPQYYYVLFCPRAYS